MARYDKFGALDDAIGTDGDYGFIGLITAYVPTS
jgi:hypothetical protein